MRADFHLSFATAGAMRSANTLGVTVLALLATGGAGNTVVPVALRAVAGASGAIASIAGAGLVASGLAIPYLLAPGASQTAGDGDGSCSRGPAPWPLPSRPLSLWPAPSHRRGQLSPNEWCASR
jgi:hypothetical protein